MSQEAKERIVITISEKAKADLKIGLHRDNLTQAMFFAAVVKAYNSCDESFMAWYADARGDLNKNKSRQKSLRKEELTAAKNIKKFGLNKDELENIFDIIAEEREGPG